MNKRLKQSKTYIGFSSTQHDPAIAIVNDAGETVFAESLERSSKNKRAWHSVPDQIGLIDQCIDKYVETEQVKVGASWSESSLLWSPLVFGLTYLKSFWFSWQRKPFQAWENSFLRVAMYKAPSSLRHMFLNLEHRFRKKQVTWSKQGVNHHLAHAYTGACTSPYEQATIVVMDGMGEGCSFAIYELQHNKIHKQSREGLLNMASLGLFYAAICEACGFDPLKGEEWKVMGLAPYGKLDASLYALLKDSLLVKDLKLVRHRNYHAIMDDLFARFEQIQTPMAAKDLAFTAQQIFEEKLMVFLEQVYQVYPNTNLILAGGCALNSAANGKILANTGFESLHIAMCPGDDGNALGVAVKLWHDDHPEQPIPRTQTPYLGSEISQRRVDALRQYAALPSQTFESDDELCHEVARLLADGKLVAWVQGKAEFGPRALGNRSILADPRNAAVKDRINQEVKFREAFRPFAPSVLAEYVEDYFDDPQTSLYMERTLAFKRFDAPGVVHVNNTGRLQSVSKALNPKFYRLIESFHKLTAVPILLNTSFNVMGRPIVHDIEDAIGVFMVSGIDVLVIGNTVFYKREPA